MQDERPEKRAVRELWVGEVETLNPIAEELQCPLYVGLTGAKGLDIQLIINKGLVTRTEVNAIATKDAYKLVAIESS